MGFDEFAKRAARKGQDPSRRELLKRAGVVGAVVATSGVIQSVTAPVYAASPIAGQCVPSDPSGCGAPPCDKVCTNGQLCATNSDCTTGACGYDKTCKLANGTTCTGNNQQTRDQSCATGYCDSATNTCAGVPTANPVTVGQDCHGANPAIAKSNCVPLAVCSSGKGSVNAASGTCKWTNGHPCGQNKECVSNHCQAGYCTPELALGNVKP